MSALLALERVSKSYGAVHALRDVTMEIRPREVVGLIGENGAGKSTLMRVLCGTAQPDRGTLRRGDAPLRLRSMQEAARHGIGMVFQEQSLLLNMTVAENIFLGQEERFTRFGSISPRRMQAAARRELAKIGVALDVAARASELSFAARQMVELAKALTLEERTDDRLVILLDEATSVLAQSDIDLLFDRVRALRERASFVFVSHRLDEVLEVSDRIYVMKDGAVVAEHAPADVSATQLHEIMVGRAQRGEYYKEAMQRPHAPRVLMQARGLGVRGAFADVDFALHEGEVLGVAGVVGSGREELSRCLGGFMPQTAGHLEVGGEAVRLQTPAHAVRRGIGYVPRERRTEGLVMFLSIATNISLPTLGAVMRAGLVIDHRRERALAQHWVEKLRIKAPHVDIACRRLSGGNQQKVVLARWMTAKSRIIVLDHPTRGLDVGAKEEVYELVRALCADGVAILLLSDTLEELIGLSHRLLVMRDGAITGRFEAPPGAKPSQVDIVRHMV